MQSNRCSSLLSYVAKESHLITVINNGVISLPTAKFPCFSPGFYIIIFLPFRDNDILRPTLKVCTFCFLLLQFLWVVSEPGVEFLGFWGREMWSKQYCKWNLMWLLGKVVYFSPKDLGALGFGKLWIQVFIKVICLMFGEECILCQ